MPYDHVCVCEDKNQPDVWGLGDRAPLLHCSSAAVTTYCGMGCMNGAVTPLLTQPAISTRAGSISFSCVVLLGWEQANEFRPFVRPSGPYHISMYVCGCCSLALSNFLHMCSAEKGGMGWFGHMQPTEKMIRHRVQASVQHKWPQSSDFRVGVK